MNKKINKRIKFIMKEYEILEQPESLQSSPSPESGILLDEANAGDAGSNLGKFKDAKSLLEAYNNLESEFTRKSQLLKQLQNDNSKAEEEVLVLQDSDAEMENANVLSQEILKPQVDNFKTADIENNNTNAAKVLEPLGDDNWQTKVTEFLNKHPNAKEFAAEITKTIMKNTALASDENALELAYRDVLANRYRSDNDVISDPEFVSNFVLNNNDIKQQIIKQYLNQVQNNNVPQLITGKQHSHVGMPTVDKPKNLAEAKLIVERMLNVN